MTYAWGFEVEARVRELYCGQKKTLKDVMATVNKEFPGMNGAKERTYQKYLKKWRITKGPRPRTPCQTSLNVSAISENTPPPVEGSITSGGDPMGHDHDPTSAESTARILNTISLSQNSHCTGLSFVSPAPSTDFPEYSMGDDSTIFPGQDSIGVGSRAGNSINTGEMTSIMYADSDVAADSSITSNPMSPMVLDQGDRANLSPVAQEALEAYLRIHPMCHADYWKLYAQTGRDLVRNSEQETEETLYADIIPFEISLQALSTKDEKILLFCSFMGSNNIAIDILSRFLKCPQEIIDSSIGILLSYGLVSQHGRNISIEGSIEKWLWVRYNRPLRLPLVQDMVIQVSNSIFLGRNPSKMGWEFARLAARYFGELTHTILRFKDSGASIWNKETLKAAVVIADTTRRAGENEQSRRILESLLPILKEICGDDDPLTLNATNALSVVFINLKKWRAAERHLRTLVYIQEQSAGIEGCSYVTHLSNWARVLVKLGTHSDAKDALTKIAELGKRVDDPIEVFIHRLKLAETQRFCGDLKEAEGLLLQILKDSREILGEDNLKTIRALELLCYVYSDQKNWAQAELNSSRLVKLSQQALGPLQPDTVRRVKFHEKIRRRRGKQRE